MRRPSIRGPRFRYRVWQSIDEHDEGEFMNTRRTLPVMAAIAVLTATTLACQLGAPVQSPLTDQQVPVPAINSQPPISVQAPVNPAAAQDAFTALYQQVIPGVVVIK